MRIATEKDYEIQPTDSIDFLIDDLARIVHSLREVNAEKAMGIKIMLDIEVK